MARKNRNQSGARYGASTSHMNIEATPRIRTEHTAEYEDLKITDNGPDTYSRVANANYLNSDAIKNMRKRKKRKHVLVGVCVSLLVVLLVGAGAAFAYVNKIGSNLQSGLDSSIWEVLSPTDTPEDPFYVLLLGVDKSEGREASGEFGGSYRSDSMMLARIDPKNKKVAIVSIPRDAKVDLGKYGTNKINAAHAFGGPTLAVQTVSKLAGVPIAHYAEIDFDGFGQIVDSLGGVEVDVPIEIDDKEAGGHLDAGRQTLNGAQALILCRSRHSYDDYGDGDLYRAANQRSVLSAIAQKLLASDAITIANSVNALSESVVTDMSLDAIVGVAQSMRGLDASTDIYTAVLPSESEYTNGVWYELIDEDEWAEMIKRIDKGLPPTEGDQVDDATGTVLASAGSGNIGTNYFVDRSATIRIRNGSGTAGVCAEAQDKLEQMGFRKFDVGNANSFDYDTTLVVYKDAKSKKDAEQIVEVFGLGKSLQDDGTYLFDSDYLIVIGSDWGL